MNPLPCIPVAPKTTITLEDILLIGLCSIPIVSFNCRTIDDLIVSCVKFFSNQCVVGKVLLHPSLISTRYKYLTYSGHRPLGHDMPYLGDLQGTSPRLSYSFCLSNQTKSDVEVLHDKAECYPQMTSIKHSGTYISTVSPLNLRILAEICTW